MGQPFIAVLAEMIAFSGLVIAQEEPLASHQAARDQQDMEGFQRMTASDLARKYLTKPPYLLFAIRRIIELGDPVVAPALQRAFEEEGDAVRREFIAAALVSLGKADVRYFDYVSAAAAAAVASILPFPGFLGAATGLGNRSGYRPDFIWAVHQQKLEFDFALRQAAFVFPGAVEALGEAADKRAFPILVKGLDSPNTAIVRAAAFGLARLHDNSGVPLIIAGCGHLLPEERPLVAKALLYFESPAARHAAAAMISDHVVLERWRKEAKRRGWKKAMRDSLR